MQQPSLFEAPHTDPSKGSQPPSTTLDKDTLERHLWAAADILRGSIDSSDYKHYIFGLLFYKRLCDVWKEEYEARLEEFGGDAEMASDPEEHRFHIPFTCMWSDDPRPDPEPYPCYPDKKDKDDNPIPMPRNVRDHSADLGTALNVAFRAIEDANPDLKGVFQDVDFANRERFPDDLLEKLLQHFEKYRMRKADVDSNILGDAYEYLIKQFADDAGKKGGEFYTPKQVVKLMVEILQPEEGMSVYDPTCGSGGMLLEAVHFMERRFLHEEAKRKGVKLEALDKATQREVTQRARKTLTLYGQERNLNTWAICKMSLFLHGLDDFRVERGDTLSKPMHKTKVDGLETLSRFDLVLANPPFSLKNWGHEKWTRKGKGKGDPYNRDTWGCPPKSYGDLAFVQHMIVSLKSRGRMACVVPHGVLFRGGAEGKIRKGILEADLLEAVVGLSNNLFYGTGIPAAVLYLNRNKLPERKGKVLIVNGDKDFIPGTNQDDLSDENVTRLARAVREYTDEDLFCRVVDISEIRDNGHNLNLTRYVQTDPPPPSIDTKKEMVKLQDLIAKRDAAEARMKAFMVELGYV